MGKEFTRAATCEKCYRPLRIIEVGVTCRYERAGKLRLYKNSDLGQCPRCHKYYVYGHALGVLDSSEVEEYLVVDWGGATLFSHVTIEVDEESVREYYAKISD